MKTTAFAAFAAAVLAASVPALHAQEAAPAGISDDQAVELARIVNAASPEEAKDAITTVVNDVLANADDAATAAGQLTAALTAAVVAQGGHDGPQLVADIVAAVAASASGDEAAALAERAAAAVVVSSGLRSFVDLVPESISTSVADAAADPLSVVTGREAAALKDLYRRVLEILTPDTYTPPTDTDAIPVLVAPAAPAPAVVPASKPSKASTTPATPSVEPSKPDIPVPTPPVRPTPTFVGNGRD